jgi:hypothetical protein
MGMHITRRISQAVGFCNILGHSFEMRSQRRNKWRPKTFCLGEMGCGFQADPTPFSIHYYVDKPSEKTEYHNTVTITFMSADTSARIPG